MTAVNPASDYSRREQITIIVSCMLGFALDLYDVLIPAIHYGLNIRNSLNISLTYVASITSVTLIGSVIGGAVFGAIGDKLGAEERTPIDTCRFRRRLDRIRVFLELLVPCRTALYHGYRPWRRVGRRHGPF